MANYTLTLADLTGRIDEQWRTRVHSLLSSWLVAANHRVPESRRFVNMTVHWTTAQIDQAATNLIIYFVPDSFTSVLASRTTQGIQDVGGLTAVGGRENASEIYLDRVRDAPSMAALAWHELMHNQMNINDRLHLSQYGGGGLAASPIAGQVPTPLNHARLAPHLPTPRQQWVGGWAAYGTLQGFLSGEGLDVLP
jgi:hypothetical protein